MFVRLGKALTISVVILVLLAFSGAKTAEILYPLEQASEAAACHRHAKPVLEIPHVHYVHMCVHAQRLGVVAQRPLATTLATTLLSTIRRDAHYCSRPPSTGLGRGPPEFAIS